MKDKWCISNVSLDNALLDGKFIEIIMLIKLVVIFLLAQINFLFLKQSSSFNVINKMFYNAGQTEINQAIFKTATIVAASLGRSGR